MKLNREHAAALRAALPFLWDGRGKEPDNEICRDPGSRKSQYVCIALWFANRAGKADNRVGYEVEKEIHRRLGGYGTVTSWLYHRHGIKDTLKHHKRAQAYRKAWMLKMIQEGES